MPTESKSRSLSNPKGGTYMDSESKEKPKLVYPSLKIPFVLLVCCFAAWGSTANLTDVLVSVFKRVFTMSNFESALVQFAYYGAYFALAIPAAYINKSFGYKAGVLTGLGMAALGGFLFIPASNFLVYEFFLLALFILAAGMSILETSANPFVIAMGPEASAAQRLNLAQSFNPVGANIGVLLGALLIVPRLTPESAKVGATDEQLLEILTQDLGLVLGPYIGIAIVLIVIWPLIAFRKIETPQEEYEHQSKASNKGVFGRLYRNKHYRYGVLAQFFNVAAQTCTWTFTIQYAQSVVGVSDDNASWFLQASLIVFLVSRFVMTYLLGIIRPSKLLLTMAVIGVVLASFATISQNYAGLIAIVSISASLSLMFPTIYGVALEGLGADTKFGAAGLVMAILGGALLPLVHGAAADVAGHAVAYAVPAACLAIVAGYALFDLNSRRISHEG